MIAFQADCAGRPKEAGQEINCLGGSCASKQCAACRLVTRAVLCSSACIGAGVGSQILCPAALHAAATGALYACAGGCAVFVWYRDWETNLQDRKSTRLNSSH